MLRTYLTYIIAFLVDKGKRLKTSCQLGKLSQGLPFFLPLFTHSAIKAFSHSTSPSPLLFLIKKSFRQGMACICTKFHKYYRDLCTHCLHIYIPYTSWKFGTSIHTHLTLLHDECINAPWLITSNYRTNTPIKPTML